MSTLHERTASDLARSFAALGVRVSITASEDGVTVPQEGARQLLARLAFDEGGSRLPFVNRLLQSPSASGVVLRGDEGRHLWRALEDIHRTRHRNSQIDRGIVPGALSASEAVRLARRFPAMAGRR